MAPRDAGAYDLRLLLNDCAIVHSWSTVRCFLVSILVLCIGGGSDSLSTHGGPDVLVRELEVRTRNQYTVNVTRGIMDLYRYVDRGALMQQSLTDDVLFQGTSSRKNDTSVTQCC